MYVLEFDVLCCNTIPCRILRIFLTRGKHKLHMDGDPLRGLNKIQRDAARMVRGYGFI